MTIKIIIVCILVVLGLLYFGFGFYNIYKEYKDKMKALNNKQHNEYIG
jgi:hypothetical protein